MKQIKRTVSLAIDIAAEKLNEISLEDVEIDQASQHRIYQTLYDMAMRSDSFHNRMDPQGTYPGVPCTGFWIEDTQELVLFAWCQQSTQTIVIPSNEWFLREDITVH